MSGVDYTVVDGIARIALARPDQANAVDLPMARALRQAVDRVAADPDARVVVISGSGSRFCAGGDVGAMAADPEPATYLLELAEGMDGALQALDALAKPVVAQVQGVAAGAGMALMLAADVVVSARSARYLTAYAGIGLTPDCGLSWLLPRAVGQQRALELMLTGRVLAAEEAQAWGLVTRTVLDETLAEETTALAATLAHGPAFAHGQARRLVRSAWAVSRAESGADEARTISRAVVRPDAQALISRFAGR